MEKKIESFWSEFLEKKNLDKHTKYVEAFHFELNEKLANELLQLVLNGQKQLKKFSWKKTAMQTQKIYETLGLQKTPYIIFEEMF